MNNDKSQSVSNPGMLKTRTVLANPYTSYIRGTKKPVNATQIPISSNYKPGSLKGQPDSKSELANQVLQNEDTSSGLRKEEPTTKDLSGAECADHELYSSNNLQIQSNSEYPMILPTRSQPSPRIAPGQVRNVVSLKNESILPLNTTSQGKASPTSNQRESNHANTKNSILTEHFSYDGATSQKPVKFETTNEGNHVTVGTEHSIIKILTQTYKQKQQEQKTRKPKTPVSQGSMHQKILKNNQMQPKTIADNLSQTSHGKPRSALPSPLLPGPPHLDEKQLKSIQNIAYRHSQKPKTCTEITLNAKLSGQRAQGLQGTKSSKFQNIKNLDSKNHFMKQRHKNTKNNLVSTKYVMPKNSKVTNAQNVTPRSMQIVQKAMVQQANTQLNTFAKRDSPNLSQFMGEKVKLPLNLIHVGSEKMHSQSNQMDKSMSRESINSGGVPMGTSNLMISDKGYNESFLQVKCEDKKLIGENERMVYQQQYQTMCNLAKRTKSEEGRNRPSNPTYSIRENLIISRRSKQGSARGSEQSDGMMQSQAAATKQQHDKRTKKFSSVNKYNSNPSQKAASQAVQQQAAEQQALQNQSKKPQAGHANQNLNLTIRITNQKTKPPIKLSGHNSATNQKPQQTLIKKKGASQVPNSTSITPSGVIERVNEMKNNLLIPSNNRMQSKIAIQMSQILNCNSPKRKEPISLTRRKFMSPPMKRQTIGNVNQISNGQTSVTGSGQPVVDKIAIQQIITKKFRSRQSMQDYKNKVCNQDTSDAIMNQQSNTKMEQLMLNQSDNSNLISKSEKIVTEQSIAKQKEKSQMQVRGKSSSNNKKEQSSAQTALRKSQNEVFLKIKEQTELHKQRLIMNRQGSASQLMVKSKRMTLQSNSSMHRNHEQLRNSKSRSQSKISRSYISNSSLGRKSSIPRPYANVNGMRIIPKSQSYLIQIFSREFWPEVQKVLRFRSKNEIVRMLSNHDLKDISGKEMEDAFLFNETDFILKNQRHWSESKDIMQISHKSLEYKINCEQTEDVMRALGFLKGHEDKQKRSLDRQNSPLEIDRSIEERIEFMKFWNLLVKVERRKRVQSPMLIEGSPKIKLFEKHLKRISTNIKPTTAMNHDLRGFSPDNHHNRFDLLGSTDNGLSLTNQVSQTFMQPETIKIMDDESNNNQIHAQSKQQKQPFCDQLGKTIESCSNNWPIQNYVGSNQAAEVVLENEESKDDDEFDEAYLKNELQGSALIVSNKSSIVVTAQKIKDAQNLDYNKTDDTGEKKQYDSIIKESSLLGQLLAPCLTTLGDNRDEEEDEEEQVQNDEEQTISIRAFLSTLLELINVKKSLVRLSVRFPILYMNRKEYEENKKKTSEYNISIQTVRSQREELASQHLERRQLFKQEKEQNIQIKQLGYFGTHRHSVNEHIKQKKMNEKLIKQGETNSNYQQYNIFMNSLRNTEIPNVKRMPQGEQSRKSRGSSRSKGRAQAAQQGRINAMTKMLHDYRKKVKQRQSMEQINVNYKDVYLTPTATQETKINLKGTSSLAAPGGGAEEPDSSLLPQAQQTSESEVICLELPAQFRSTQQVQKEPRKKKNINSKGKSAEIVVERRIARASASIETEEAQALGRVPNTGKFGGRQSQREVEIANSKSVIKSTVKAKRAKKQSRNANVLQKQKHSHKKSSVNLKSNQDGDKNINNAIKINEILEELPKFKQPKILKYQQSPKHQGHGISIQFSTVRSTKEKPLRKQKQSHDVKTDKKTLETIEYCQGAPVTGKKDKMKLKKKASPVIVIDLDEIRTKQKMKKNPSAFLRTQRTPEDKDDMSKNSKDQRMKSQGRNRDLSDRTYLGIALQKKKMNNQQTGSSEALSHRSQRSTTRVKNRSLRTHSSFNFEQASMNNESLRQRDESLQNAMQTHDLFKNEEQDLEESATDAVSTDRPLKQQQILRKKKEVKTRMTTLSEEAEFNLQETTNKKDRRIKAVDSIRNLFGSYQNLSDKELDLQIQQIQQEYQEIEDQPVIKIQSMSPQQLFVSPSRSNEASSLLSGPLRIASPADQEANPKEMQKQKKGEPNEQEVQRVSQPTTFGHVSPKDINDQSISSIKLNYEMQQNDQQQKSQLQHPADGTMEEVAEEVTQENVVNDLDDSEQEDEEASAESPQDEENIYFFEPTNHYKQVQLRHHLKQANKSQQVAKKVPIFNDDIIKETFREDSLASSEEGILASQSPGQKGANRTKTFEEYGTSLALTETGLVDGLDSGKHNFIKMSHLKGLNISASQNSAENVKKSVSSDGDISKLKADVLKFMQKQESREQQNLRKSSDQNVKSASHISPSSKGVQRLNQQQQEKELKELPILFSEENESPLEHSRDPASSRNANVVGQLSLSIIKQKSTLTEKQEEEKHRSAKKRKASRNSQMNKVSSKPEKVDDVLVAEGHRTPRKTPSKSVDKLTTPDNVNEVANEVNRDKSDSSYVMQPMLFQTFAPSKDSQHQDTPALNTPVLNGGGNTAQTSCSIDINKIKDNREQSPTVNLSRRKSSKRKQPKQNSLQTESPRPIMDSQPHVNLITQSSADDLLNQDASQNELQSNLLTTSLTAEKDAKRTQKDDAFDLAGDTDEKREHGESKVIFYSQKPDDDSMNLSMMKEDEQDQLVRDLQQIEVQVEKDKQEERRASDNYEAKDTEVDELDEEQRLRDIDQLASALHQAQQKYHKQKQELPQHEVVSETQRSDIFEKSVQNQPLADDASIDDRPQSFTTDNQSKKNFKMAKQRQFSKSGVQQQIHTKAEDYGLTPTNVTPRNAGTQPVPLPGLGNTGKNLTHRGTKTHISNSVMNVNEQLREIIESEHKMIKDTSQEFKRSQNEGQLNAKNSLQLPTKGHYKPNPLITHTDSMKSLDGNQNMEMTADRLNLQFDDNSTIFLNAPSQISSKMSSPVRRQRPTFSNQSSEYSPRSKNFQRYKGNLQSIPEKPVPRVLKFEIHIDQHFGTQVLEIIGKQNLRQNVERFALKFGIRDQSKLNKLMKLVKRELKKQQCDEDASIF